jgi:hypothetical protein
MTKLSLWESGGRRSKTHQQTRIVGRFYGGIEESRTAEPIHERIEVSGKWVALHPVVTSTNGEQITSGKPKRMRASERELLWTVANHSRRIMCELRYHGKYGVEYRLYYDNEFYQGRGFQTRELAVTAADALRRRLEDTGWSSPTLNVVS